MFSTLAGIVQIIKGLMTALGAFLGWYQKHEQDVSTQELQKSVDDAKNAKSLQEKADAACKITKHFNPDIDCDKPAGNK